MLQKLPIALAKTQTSNTSENLLNKICQIIFSLYWAKSFNKKVHNNIMNAIQNWYYI